MFAISSEACRLSRRCLLLIFLAAIFLSSCSVTSYASRNANDVIGYGLLDSALTVGKVRILSILRIPDIERDGLAMVELSGLAWSEDEQTLYAQSDHGMVFHLHPVFESGSLIGVTVSHAYPLKDASGADLIWPRHDSEGLAILNASNSVHGDDELVVSYELKPRVQKHTATGSYKGKIKLPDALEDVDSYDSRNRALEAVTVHPEYGVLTIPELSLYAAQQQAVTIYAASGQQWVLPQNEEQGLSVVALETMPDGKLMLLQRKHRLFGAHWTSVLNRLSLHDDGKVQSELLATLSSADETLRVDNFEGLTHYKGNRYFMISDNNEHPLQETLLVYFELIE